MSGLALASFVAWLIARDEGEKFLVGMFTFALMVVVLLHLARHLLEWRPHRTMIVLAALASLASCTGQMMLARSDLAQIVRDMAHFNCLEARRIVRTGHGFGRDWERTDQTDQWHAKTPGALKFHDLYLTHRPGPDRYSLDVPMPDMPSAYVECRPDPRAPASVSLIN